ncbi:hypothetical protein PQX77_015420 [Marasmius sp. AFHP31]|nr:hypothetical protein PQX77_015420 [Marasmius sp. AFHP31]
MAAPAQTPRGAGRKPVLRSKNPTAPSTMTVQPNSDTTSPSKPTNTASPAPSPADPGQTTPSLPHTEPKPPRAGVQTRTSNKNVHPAAIVKAYTQIRRSGAEVKADKEKKQLQEEANEKKRLTAQNQLAQYEDQSQLKQKQYNVKFANPAVQQNISAPSAKRNTGSSKPLSRRELLLKELEKLNEEEMNGTLNDNKEGMSNEEPDVEMVVDAEDEVEAVHTGSGGRKRKARTTRAAINDTRTVPPSTPNITRPPSPATTVSNKRKLNDDGNPPNAKKTKALNVAVGLKKGSKSKRSTTKSANNEASDDAMLREGTSFGFEDNKHADMVERGSITIPNPRIEASVKIASKPLQLLSGKAARQPGETKFTARHLPDFITKSGGYRTTFAPLAK